MSEKKKKNNTVSMNRWLFLVLWVLAHTFAWGATYGLVETVNPVGDGQMFLAVTFLLGIVPGILLSFPQKWLMNKGLGLDLKWWRRISVGAWASGGILLWMAIWLFMDNFRDPPIPLVMLTWFGPLVLAQYFLMRRHIERASLYALANIASVIVFTQFVGIYGDAELFRFATSGMLQGAVTGLTLLWLYGMAQQEKSKHGHAQDDESIERLRDSSVDVGYQLEDGTDSASTTSYS